MRRSRPSRPLAAALLGIAVATSACTGGGPDEALDGATWEEVVAAARGQTVRWYIWGGSEAINTFVDQTYGVELEQRYDVRLERVPVADTVDAVNQVLAEKQAGTQTGSVDLIWVNGENFATLKQAGMLRPDWSRTLPNAAHVDWEDPAVSKDFGVDVEGYESPWSSAQLQLIHDSARTDADDLPRSYAELATWACTNPGRFTYIAPGPGGFVGTRFVKGALYELSGGAEQWTTFDEATWQTHSPALWEYLEELEPCLWRKGATYPRDENELHRLFANGEVDLSLTQAAAGPGALITEGLIPTTSTTFTFRANAIGDYNYVTIPVNAPHPAAAMVLANLLLDPAMQARHVVPDSGFGLGLGIDVDKVTDPQLRRQLAEAAARRGPNATPVAELQAARVPDTAAAYQDLVETQWRRQILGAA